MGVSGALNDGADVTARVDDFWPNDYGLYHMAGNVSEWVMDVYRPTSNEVTDDFMPLEVMYTLHNCYVLMDYTINQFKLRITFTMYMV